MLLACLAAAGCSGARFMDDAPEAAAAPPAAATPAPPPAPSAAAAPPRRGTPAASGGSGASGGARTAASRPPPEPVDPGADPLTQARVECWMKVEKEQRNTRDIDRRIAFVDKCVSDFMKGQR